MQHDPRQYEQSLANLRWRRGIPLTKEQELKNIEEDEAFQDEVRDKFGPVDVVELLKQVREG